MGKKSNKRKKRKKKRYQKPLQRKTLWVILVSFILLLLLPSIILQVYPDGFDESHSNNINCRISFTSLITTNYEGIIELTLTNKSKDHIPSVEVFLYFPTELPIVISSKEGSSVADFGNLRAEETKSRKIKFYLNRSIAKPITFDLRVFCGKSEELNSPPYKIRFIWFFSNIINLSAWILGALATIVMAITIEKLKKKFV